MTVRRREFLIGFVAALFASCVVPPLQIERTYRYRLGVPFDEYRRRLAQHLGGEAELAELSPTRLRVRDPNEVGGAIELQERDGMLVARSLFSEAATDDTRSRYRNLLRRVTALPELGPRIDSEGRVMGDGAATASRGPGADGASPVQMFPTANTPPPRAAPVRPRRRRVQ